MFTKLAAPGSFDFNILVLNPDIRDRVAERVEPQCGIMKVRFGKRWGVEESSSDVMQRVESNIYSNIEAGKPTNGFTMDTSEEEDT